MKRHIVAGTLGALVLSAAALSAAGGLGTFQAAGAAQKGKVTLAFTGTLSGSFASYAIEMRQGFNLAIKQLNQQGGLDGRKIVAIYRDDQGSAQNGPVIANEFCGNRSVRAVVGYSFSNIAVAAAPVYGRCGLPTVGAAVTSPLLSGISPYFFRTSATDASQGTQMANYLVKHLKVHRIAVLYQESDYGIGGDKSFVKTARADGANILYNQGYKTGAVDYSTQLTTIKALRPQLIYDDGFYNEMAKIAQQARGLGIKAQLAGTDGSLSPTLVKLGGSSVNGMLLYGLFNPSTPGTAVAKKFVVAFKKVYHQPPSSWAGLAYDAVFAIDHAAKIGGGDGRKQIEKGLRKVHFTGVTGPVSFDRQGNRKAKILVLRVKGGRFSLVTSNP